jgi:hypothetical protein
MEGRAEKTRERVGLEQQLANNAEQLAFVQRKLNEVSAGSSRTERDAVIVVDKADAAPGLTLRGPSIPSGWTCSSPWTRRGRWSLS